MHRRRFPVPRRQGWRVPVALAVPALSLTLTVAGRSGAASNAAGFTSAAPNRTAAARGVTGPTVVVRRDPDADATDGAVLYESDGGNDALACAEGRAKPFDHRDRVCRTPQVGRLRVDSVFGPVDLQLYAVRATYDNDGGYGLREDVLVLSAEGRPVHSLVQWKHDVNDGGMRARRRRYRSADIDGEAPAELCIENVAERGASRYTIDAEVFFRPQRRDVGYDAFEWDGTHLVRREALDSRCPRSGYRIFVDLPLTEEPVHQRRGH